MLNIAKKAFTRSRSSSSKRGREEDDEDEKNKGSAHSLPELYTYDGHSLGLGELREIKRERDHRARAPEIDFQTSSIPESRIVKDFDGDIVMMSFHDGNRTTFKVDQFGPVTIKRYGDENYELPNNVKNELITLAIQQWQILHKTKGEGIHLLKNIPQRQKQKTRSSSSEDETDTSDTTPGPTVKSGWPTERSRSRKVNVIEKDTPRKRRTGESDEATNWRETSEITGDTERSRREKEDREKPPKNKKLIKAFIKKGNKKKN